MPTHPTPAVEPRSIEQVSSEALARLREQANPFVFSVATAGTQDNCHDFDVPELLDSQRSDLKAIVQLFRGGSPASRPFPILGAPGAGKTHLLNTFRIELDQEAVARGDECLLIVADHFSLGVDPIDFFFWQVVNHLLTQKGPGARALSVISDRLTARLLGEALRRLSPPEQVALVPAVGVWERIRRFFQSRASVERRLAAVRNLILRCDVAGPNSINQACTEAGLPADVAIRVVRDHLERTESRDVAGALRKELYSRLIHVTFFKDREPIEDYLTEEYREGPAHVTGAGQLTRRLLTVFLEVFRELSIPVVLVFDQLEDFLVAPTEEQKKERRETFSRAVAALVNNVPGLCLLVFAEQGLWNEAILASLDMYVRQRLDQPFSLPGRAARREIEMPSSIGRHQLEGLIEKRVRSVLGDFDTTGLSRIFPFAEEHLAPLARESTIRECVRRLCARYDEVVFARAVGAVGPPATPPPETEPVVDEKLLALLKARWQTARASARRALEDEGQTKPSLIPKIQSALECWLISLQTQGITGDGSWAKVELLQDTEKGSFGYLTVIRTERPEVPGVGIAAWMGEKKWRMIDLRRRLEFFDQVPCPIRTLVLFRRDGDGALTGETSVVYEQAMGKGLDIRLKKYETDEMVSLLAFPLWQQSVKPDLEAVGTAAQVTLHQFVARLSGDLLQWVNAWTKPQTGGRT